VTVVLDTSLLIDGYDPGDQPVAISVVSIGELQHGVLSAIDPDVQAARQERLTAILAGTEILPITVDIAARYGALRNATGRKPTNDLWIAATADSHQLELLTGDEPQSLLPIHAVRYIPPQRKQAD
jgi:predicted nucleic acid-binding protein